MSAVFDKLKQFLVGKKLGIQYDVDPMEDGDARGGIFQELIVVSTNFTLDKDVSEVPLEKSKVFNDNIRLKSLSGTMRVFISNYRNSFLPTNAFSLITKGTAVSSTLDLFEKIQKQSMMCDIVSMLREYKNMQLISYSIADEDKSAGNYTYIDLSFKEIMFFEKVTTIDKKRLNLISDNGVGLDINKGILA